MSDLSARAFARQALRDGLRLAPTGHLRITEHWTELVLYRNGARQVELIVLQPGACVPPHKHLRCDSADFALAGNGHINVKGHALPFGLGRLLSVPLGVAHSGSAGSEGAAYLSFQVWRGGKPALITDDWEAA